MEALPAATDTAREVWANQGWVQVSLARESSFSQMEGQKKQMMRQAADGN